MYVIHTSLVFASSEKTIYSADVVSCRWVNKARGRWSGRLMRATGRKLEVSGSEPVHSADVRARCDALSRQVAAELGMAAGPDIFPFSD